MKGVISTDIAASMERSSWIRKMFEEGDKLKALLGPENVQDLTLGNPVLEPPRKILDNLKKIVNEEMPGFHKYMNNAGFMETRNAIAEWVSRVHEVPIYGDNVIMTAGAAGALNVIMKTILEPEDEVIILIPFFVEYIFYAANHRGKAVPVKMTDDFDIDVEAIQAAINPKTRAVIVNYPNNPSGSVCTLSALKKLGEVLKEASKKYERPIYLISDEPYRRVSYGADIPSPLAYYDYTFLVTSFSKDLGLAGERIGFIAVSSKIPGEERGQIMSGLTLCNRILGFVNANALMQRTIVGALDETVDLGWYKERRDLLYKGITDAGLECSLPAGAFFLFPKVPIDDVEFTNLCKDKGVLVVPGRGFGAPGYVRLSYVAEIETIKKAIPKIREVMDKIKAQE